LIDTDEYFRSAGIKLLSEKLIGALIAWHSLNGSLRRIRNFQRSSTQAGENDRGKIISILAKDKLRELILIGFRQKIRRNLNERK
jgi:hypothetical protein